MTVNKGDFLVITGESGSGKSSLCMAMTGVSRIISVAS